ncbi:putative pre-rRNA processing nucleolar protein Sik1 [Lineolata rhizophorae]|uniref:Nucleolar protein 56 n=1 Tax=Lineolata rhizophorae TaxID=578093 RepID=A0A6A6P722_9PEZI|nr:putative pre-rRNA processing nucleolar protein Sik1 [Lineolata rhizophorae]
MAEYLLFESPVGYAVFNVTMKPDTVGSQLKEVQDALQKLDKFGKMVKLVSFIPFQNSDMALENLNELSEGLLPEHLRNVLEANLPQGSKKNKVVLGVAEKNLAGSIRDAFPHVECETPDTSDVVGDLLRGIRLHFAKMTKTLQTADVDAAQHGLGHAYSRAKVKFNVNRNDNHIIQSIATLDSLDKTVNLLAMRTREWYSWHFPELKNIVSDNEQYCRLVLFIGDKATLTDDKLHDLAALVNDDEGVAKAVISNAKTSFGNEVMELDMIQGRELAQQAVREFEHRRSLAAYLVNKMSAVAPNLAALIGETVGARLIQKAGSLTNLSKCSASTVQILGAEKALFRALKSKSATPKYGIIYHSSFIGRAAPKNKGRISRFLANKASIASRIDSFSTEPTTAYGDALKAQVEERLNFYASGGAMTKNDVAMENAMNAVLNKLDDIADETEAGAGEDESMDTEWNEKRKEAKEKKKEKKERKEKKEKEKKRKSMEAEDGKKHKKKKSKPAGA